MKKDMRFKVISAVLSLAMVFTMIPILGSQAHAASGGPSINLVKDGNTPNIAGSQESNVWFGNYKQSSNASGFNNDPVKWRVLDTAEKKLFLLSDQNLDVMKYNESNESVTWETCTIRAWLNGTGTYADDSFMGNAFSSGEQSVILTTLLLNKDNIYPYLTPGGKNTEDKIFLLSFEEAKNTNYGFTADTDQTSARVATNTEYVANGGRIDSDGMPGVGEASFWWLRSPGYDENYAAGINPNGEILPIGPQVTYKKYAVRPALNLNMKDVLLTTAVEYARPDVVGEDSLQAPGEGEYSDWKLTLKDKAHNGFKVDSVRTCDGKVLNIKYSGAKKGDNEYISAIVKGSNGSISSYGKLALASDKNGASAKVNIEGKMAEGQTLCIFNEQCNGNNETDYSSPLQEIEIPPAHHKYGAWTKLDDKQHQRVCEYDAAHVEKENHKWDGGTVTKKATTTATGVKTWTCTVCKATKTETIPKLAKKANPLKVKGKIATIKYSKLKKKTQKLAVTKAIKFTKKLNDKKTYTLVSAKKGKKSFKKYFKINKKTGKVTIKKNKKMKKGTYKVKVKVKAKGNANYKASAIKKVTFKVKVK